MFDDDGAMLNEKHTYRDLGLYIKSIRIAPPKPRVYKITVPGRDGCVDLSEINGGVTYENRSVEIVLNGKKEESAWIPFMSAFMNLYHGRTVKVIFDCDPSYYYIGRASVEADFEKGVEVACFTLALDADPYKYEVTSSLDDWLWDPLCFETDIVREYKDMVVDGSRELVIPALRKRLVPVIYASSDMTVTFNGEIYTLAAGINKIYDISLPEGENVLIFTGHGTVSVDYRGGSL